MKKKFRVEQNYTQVGTKYYEVEAESLEEAIKMAEEDYSDVDFYDEDIWDYETDYDGSEEVKEAQNEKS